MTTAHKNEIQLLLSTYIGRYSSQAKAVASLREVSEATIINILKENWLSISPEMWRKVGKQVGWNGDSSERLLMVETLAFNTFITYFSDARDYGNMFIITAPCGSGKSYTAEFFRDKATNVMYLPCQKQWNRKWFLRKVLQNIGKKWEGLGITELMDTLISELLKMDKPVLIFDEAHKLSDENFLFFIELYNELNGKCGIVVMGNAALTQKMTKGRNSLRIGFEDIYSRAGRRFITPPTVNHKELEKICRANGIDDETVIAGIYNDFEGDLRRAERQIHKIKRGPKAA